MSIVFFEDDRGRLTGDRIRVRAIHGAPDLGTVDLHAVAPDGTPASLLLADLAAGTLANVPGARARG